MQNREKVRHLQNSKLAAWAQPGAAGIKSFNAKTLRHNKPATKPDTGLAEND
jgi:hypothetical protein